MGVMVMEHVVGLIDYDWPITNLFIYSHDLYERQILW